jgi:hypothetical protein
MKHHHRFFRILERLGAGGYVQPQVILEVLKRCFVTEECLEITDGAPTVCYSSENDTCAVCLCSFTDPLQLGCGHVYCHPCVAALKTTGIRTCPSCRQPFDKVYVPVFSCKRKIVDCSSVPPSTLFMQGKVTAFAEAIQRWQCDPVPVVCCAKESQCLPYFMQILDDLDICFAVAGISVLQKESLIAIEMFKRGEVSILFLGPRYYDGFDLFMGKEIWFLNTDLRVQSLEQGKGRLTRLSQRHNEIVVRVFMYPQGFDHFLWVYRDRLANYRFYKKELVMFHLFQQNSLLACKIRRFLDHTGIPWEWSDLWYDSHSSYLRYKNHHFSICLPSAEIVCPPRYIPYSRAMTMLPHVLRGFCRVTT